MSFIIVTDTSANLPTPYLKANHIEAVPFYYFVEGKPYACLDTEQFDDVAFYNQIRKGVKVSTSQVTLQQYLDVFTPALERGEDVLFISMSSGISGSFGCAQMASAELREQYPQRTIRLVDTLGASLGEGLLVVRAEECLRAGMTVDQTAELLLRLRHEMCQVFTVDDLMHLRRTGRLSNASAVIGTVLGIKPLLKGDTEGKIVSFAKIRGRKASIQAIADNYDRLVRDAEHQTIGIAHADCPEDAAYLSSLLQRKHPPREIMTVKYEPVTGSHVGPGALALFFMGEETFRGE